MIKKKKIFQRFGQKIQHFVNGNDNKEDSSCFQTKKTFGHF